RTRPGARPRAAGRAPRESARARGRSPIAPAGNASANDPSRRASCALYRTLHHQLLDLADGPGRVEVFRAGVDAVHDAMTTEQAVRVLEIVEALGRRLVAAVGDEAVGLQQARRADELVRVPPERGAGGRAAGAQDALVEAVELLALRG